MAPGILNKLRRRPSASLPLRQPPQSYVHHASTPPEWPTSPAQTTPDVYITSPPEDDGLLTSVCVHRAVEHEPKRLRKLEDRASLPPPPPSSFAFESEPEPPVFRRSSLQTPDVVLPKKPSEIVRESAAKFLSRQNANTDESPAGDEQTARVQFEKQPLARVSSGREAGDGQLKTKATLRHRASKVLKSFTNRESLTFGSSAADKRNSQPDARTNGSHQQKRRNTLSDSSQSAFNMLAQAATAHAIPSESMPPSTPPATRTSGEGRRRSSTLTHVDFTPRPVSPPLPPLANSPDVEETPAISVPPPAVMPLKPAAEIVEAAQPLPEQSSGASKDEKAKKLQPRRSKNTFSHLFNLKNDKGRSPPPAKPAEEAVPPVPVIPQELAKAVADPETPETSQSSTFASPASTAATPKSSKSKRFRRHRRRATVGSVSHISTDVTGTPSSKSQAETPKTPPSPRTRSFAIVDLRKGFTVRGLGKSKGKLLSAKSSPSLKSPPPPMAMAPAASGNDELPETVVQRLKSRPPPLQSTESQPTESPPAPANEEHNTSPTTVEFESPEGNRTSLPSPTESNGPSTPMSDAQEGSTHALSTGLAPAIELDEPKATEEVPELSFTPPTSEESDQTTHRPSTASEATMLSEELFGSLNSPSTIGNLDLQLREPSTKTSTLDAHLRLGSLRFDHFSFDTNVF